MKSLTHFNSQGVAHMVDIGQKGTTERIAIAEGFIEVLHDTLILIKQGDSKKGDVLGIARVAAIMASKKTAELIPLCHPIALTHVDVNFQLLEDTNQIRCEVLAKCNGSTGVEMEALTAVNVALLTIYDMCKSVDRGMVIKTIRLLEKAGGKSGHWQASP